MLSRSLEELIVFGQLEDSGIVETTTAEFPTIAVNVLHRLGYQVSLRAKTFGEILALLRYDELIGQDIWHNEYRVLIRWRETRAGDAVLVKLTMDEKKGGATTAECQRRSDEIFLEMQSDAKRT
jgi:hypothetical protein